MLSCSPAGGFPFSSPLAADMGPPPPLLACLLLSLTAALRLGLKEGAECGTGVVKSVCKPLVDCPNALAAIKLRKSPTICSFKNESSIIICCQENNGTTQSLYESISNSSSEDNVLQNEKDGDNSTYILQEDQLYPTLVDQSTISKENCSGIPCTKCKEYADLVYGKETIDSETFVINRCGKTELSPLWEEKKIEELEFPHMALIGFNKPVVWSCAGSLISEKFVLTSALCARYSKWGNAEKVQLGTLNNNSEAGIITDVASVYVHPYYFKSHLYFDVALLELLEDVKFSANVRPICLGGFNENDPLIAMRLKPSETDNTSMLAKCHVLKTKTNECFQDGNSTAENEDSHLCVGSISNKSQSDSGAILISERNDLYCMYNVIGVGTLGNKNCSLGSCNIYMKVASIMSWIEDIVWDRDSDFYLD